MKTSQQQQNKQTLFSGKLLTNILWDTACQNKSNSYTQCCNIRKSKKQPTNELCFRITINQHEDQTVKRHNKQQNTMGLTEM